MSPAGKRFLEDAVFTPGGGMLPGVEWSRHASRYEHTRARVLTEMSR